MRGVKCMPRFPLAVRYKQEKNTGDDERFLVPDNDLIFRGQGLAVA